MKKSLLTILAATTMFTGVAKAEISNSDLAAAVEAGNSAICHTLDKGSAFNKRTLSDFDKCWIKVHKAGEVSGTIDGFVWVKAMGEITAVSFKELRDAGSKDKAKEVIINTVINNTMVAQLEANISRLESEKAELVNSLSAAEGDLEDKIAEIGRLNDALTHMGTVYTSVRTALTINDRVFDNATAIYNNGKAVQMFNITNDLYGQGVENIATDARDRYLAGNGTIGEFVGAILSIERTEALAGYTLDTSGNTQADSAIEIDSSNVTENLGEEYWEVTLNDGTVHRFTTGGSARLFSSQNPGSTVEAFSGNSYTVSINGSTVSFNDAVITADLIANAVEEAYNVGYDDGYDAGYADGYADGFADGVASVR